MSNEIWHVAVDPPVWKTLRRIPRNDSERILTVLQDLQRDPYGGDAHKLRGAEHSWRRRVGSYRIFFEVLVSERRVDVFHLERRGSKTY